jgi:hypothetical protein
VQSDLGKPRPWIKLATKSRPLGSIRSLNRRGSLTPKLCTNKPSAKSARSNHRETPRPHTRITRPSPKSRRNSTQDGRRRSHRYLRASREAEPRAQRRGRRGAEVVVRKRRRRIRFHGAASDGGATGRTRRWSLKTWTMIYGRTNSL